jgi:hypothetical protein
MKIIARDIDEEITRLKVCGEVLLFGDKVSQEDSSVL